MRISSHHNMLLFYLCTLLYCSSTVQPLPINGSSSSSSSSSSSEHDQTLVPPEINTASSTINCSLPQSTINFTPLLAGLRVLQTYSRYQIQTADINALISTFGTCRATVTYKNAKTFGLIPTANNIALWYTVMNSYKQYLNTLQYIDTAEHNTTTSLIAAINDEFFTILQDIHCNCTDDCVINQPKYDNVTDSCTSPLIHVHFLLAKDILPQLVYTVKQYRELCLCDASSNDTTSDPVMEWLTMNFPADDPDFDIIRQLISF